jgi:hypothetical protein
METLEGIYFLGSETCFCKIYECCNAYMGSLHGDQYTSACGSSTYRSAHVQGIVMRRRLSRGSPRLNIGLENSSP